MTFSKCPTLHDSLWMRGRQPIFIDEINRKELQSYLLFFKNIFEIIKAGLQIIAYHFFHIHK
jgi:hypothetical protein